MDPVEKVLDIIGGRERKYEQKRQIKLVCINKKGKELEEVELY